MFFSAESEDSEIFTRDYQFTDLTLHNFDLKAALSLSFPISNMRLKSTDDTFQSRCSRTKSNQWFECHGRVT